MFQKTKWKHYGLKIDDAVLNRDPDLVPLLVLMHDAAVSVWETRPMYFRTHPPSELPNMYFDLVTEAGLEGISRYVSEIQRQRVEAGWAGWSDRARAVAEMKGDK